MEENNKKVEAAQRMSMFLNMLLMNMNVCNCGLGIDKNQRICIIDNQTGFVKYYEINEFNAMLEAYNEQHKTLC